MTKKVKGITARIVFTPDSPYRQHGEKERVVENLTEVHYSYPTPLNIKSTAFESDIEGTGFTIMNCYIEEIEISLPPNKNKEI